jgi:ComF family protein
MGRDNERFGRVWEPAGPFRRAGRVALDLIYPHRALDDDAPVQTPGLSVEGWSRVAFLDDPVCDGCGTPFEFSLGPGALCAACLAKPRAFDRARAACLYDDASRGLILQLKYADRTDLSRLFAAWISRSARDLLAGADAIAPVPLHPSRLFRRRYNQAAEIARPLARLWSRDYLADVLVRRRDTGAQAGRSGSGRRRNVAAAFAVPEGRRRLVEGRRILLIDDVMTTGATLESCARALRAAGAAGVDAAVIARVKDPASLTI